MPLSGIRDNYRRGTAAEFLRAKIAPDSHLSIVSAYFTIYAFDALEDHLARIKHLNFLFVRQPGVIYCLRHKGGDEPGQRRPWTSTPAS